MKKHKWSLLLLSLLIPLFILAGCNSKQNLKGKWNVQDSNHEYTTVTFTDKKVSVNGQEAEYKQVEVGFKNNVQYIVIEMEGKKYSIIFPDADKNIAVLLQPTSEDNYLEGTMILAMNRKEKPNYDKYAKKLYPRKIKAQNVLLFLFICQDFL